MSFINALPKRVSSFLHLLRGKCIAPEHVPTDTILPLHSYDDGAIQRSMIVDFSLRFDDVLDVQKLVRALEQLLEKPGWRKLGARLRLNNNGKLEYHIPAQYTPSRPAINFAHAIHSMPMSSHPLTQQLIRPNGSFQVSPPRDVFQPLFPQTKSLRRINDWLYTDRAQLQLEFVSFTDGTLVSLTWLHTLMDGMSRAALFNAWQAMLEGRENDVPELDGYDFDPLVNLGDPEQLELQGEGVQEGQEFVLKDRLLTGLNSARFGLGYIWDYLFNRNQEMRQVCIPPGFFEKLRQEGIEDLQRAPQTTTVMDTTDQSNLKPFISEGDVVAVWWTRLILSCQSWTSSHLERPIYFTNIFDMRNLLESTEPKLLQKGKAFIGNCVISLYSFFSIREFLSAPLSILASRIRKDLVTQSTRAQVNASQRLAKVHIKRTGYVPLYGPENMLVILFPNRTKGEPFQTDFSAAVVKEGKVGHVRGKPTYVLVDGVSKRAPNMQGIIVDEKDPQGNYWLSALQTPETWRIVKQAIESMV